jgi:hypothetical protein
MSSALLTELRRPATVIAILVAILFFILGTIISLYFYYKGIKEGQVSFQVEQVQVYDGAQLALSRTTGSPKPPITVLDASGNPITENIYAASITVWNSGNGEIRHDSIREKFVIRLSSNPHVLELSPTFFTNENADKFTVDERGGIEWDHFDAGEGFKAKALYASPNQQNVFIEGRAVEYRGIVDLPKIAAEERAKIKVEMLAILTVSAIFAALVIITVVSRIRAFLKTSATTLPIMAADVFLFVMSILIAASIVFLYLFADLAPNFRAPF